MAVPAEMDAQTRALDMSQVRIVRVGAPDPADTEDAPRLRDVDKIEFCAPQPPVDVVGTADLVIVEFTIDFDRMTCAMIDVQIAAGLAVLAGGGVGTIKLWVGAAGYAGFLGAPGGTLRASASTGAAVGTPVSGTGAAFAKPAGAQIVQVSIVGSLLTSDVEVQAIHGSFKGV